ncbi:MAG: MXAN_6521/LA_1396 family lipoprotein [Myxococcaceae bacterium]|jgi:probable lipoprotein (TIGR04455 family)|nr:MXAN_6521/LA_1396 family lipoprotein [Myxococcaceae bacterium]
MTAKPGFGVVVALALVSGCSVVKAYTVRDDWATVDRAKVKRLVVVVQPLPDGQEKAGELFARVARRYVNMKRDFLVKQERASATLPALATLCGGDDAIEGVLRLSPVLTRRGGGFEVELEGALLRCGDGREAWTARAAGSFSSADERLVEVTKTYVGELGAEVEPYVAPAMNVLRPVLDTLPQPLLSDADQDEKVGLVD